MTRKKRVYVETTIPSFYHETRPEPDMVARRNWTRLWWDDHRKYYDVVTSIPVLEELEKGKYRSRDAALRLLDDIPLLSMEEGIEEIVDAYVSHHVMPSDPRGDALHLALASHHHCHFLLTWNCAHLANANKFEHIRHVNTLLGLYVPVLTTPVELLGREKMP